MENLMSQYTKVQMYRAMKTNVVEFAESFDFIQHDDLIRLFGK